MTQLFLTEKIISLFRDAVKEANIKDTPSVHKEMLHKDESGPERSHS